MGRVDGRRDLGRVDFCPWASRLIGLMGILLLFAFAAYPAESALQTASHGYHWERRRFPDRYSAFSRPTIVTLGYAPLPSPSITFCTDLFSQVRIGMRLGVQLPLALRDKAKLANHRPIELAT